MPNASDPAHLRKMLNARADTRLVESEDIYQTPEDEDREGNLQSVPDVGEPGFQWTIKRRRFVHILARTGNQGEAAKAAGYSGGQAASRLLKYQTIRTAVQREVLYLLTAEGISQESIISKWHMWADSNIFDYFEVEDVARLVPDPMADQALEDPPMIVQNSRRLALKDITTLTEDQQKCVKKISTRDSGFGQNVIIELEDRQRPMDRLAEFFGMIKGDNVTAETPQETANNIRDLLLEMNANDAGQVHQPVASEPSVPTEH